MKRELVGLGLAASMTLAAGCGEKAAQQPPTSLQQKDIFAAGHVTRIARGQSAFLEVIAPGSTEGKAIISATQLVDHQYPHDSTDNNAPGVSAEPMRVVAKTTVKGGDGEFENDASCDTYPIAEPQDFIGAVALGGQSDGAMVTWPVDHPGNVYVCTFNGMAPRAEDGIAIFTTNQQM